MPLVSHLQRQTTTFCITILPNEIVLVQDKKFFFFFCESPFVFLCVGVFVLVVEKVMQNVGTLSVALDE